MVALSAAPMKVGPDITDMPEEYTLRSDDQGTKTVQHCSFP
jgi:hypothetical protein